MKKISGEKVEKFKALYIHIPKTGGSSIAKAPWILKHGSYRKNPKIPMSSMDYLKLSFTFVRNPYTRFTSAVLNHGYATPETFVEFVTKTFLSEYKERLEEWNVSERVNWVELQPQYRYVYFDELMPHGFKLPKPAIDFVGKFEKLEEGWEKVCGLVGEKFKLPHENRSKYPGHVKLHTKKTREIVRRAYAKDFDLFGYQR